LTKLFELSEELRWSLSSRWGVVKLGWLK